MSVSYIPRQCCSLASFPRKRESRAQAPRGLDARLRGHDVLLVPNLRNGHRVRCGSSVATGIALKRNQMCPPPGGGYLWQHYCAAKEVSSGAPLFYEGPLGQPVVLALNRDEAPPLKDDPAQTGDTFRTEDSKHANLALDISTIYPEVQALLHLENMTAGWEKTNPLIRETQ